MYGDPQSDAWLEKWVARVVHWARRDDLHYRARDAHELAMRRCHPVSIAAQWEKLFGDLILA